MKTGKCRPKPAVDDIRYRIGDLESISLTYSRHYKPILRKPTI